MSTRLSRKSTPVPQTPAGTSSGSNSGSRSSSRIGQRDRSSSPPASPTRISRLQEKRELQNLNDRLACYIDQVRSLQGENEKLRYELHTTQEIKTRDVTSLKEIYDAELQQLRRALDNEAIKTARVEVEKKNLEDRIKEEGYKQAKLADELKAAEKEAATFQTKYNDIMTKYNKAIAENRKLGPENKRISKELIALRVALEEKTKQLECETLQRVEAQNRCQSMQESLAFAQQVHEQELSESRIVTRQIEISDVDGQLTRQAEEKYVENLQALRTQYEEDLKRNREDLKRIYDEKLKNLEMDVERKNGLVTGSFDDLRKVQVEMEGVRKALQASEAKAQLLQDKATELETFLQSEKRAHAFELMQMQETLSNHLQEHQDLLDVKVALDLEIAAYRRLLEGEEARLNYTPNTTPGGSCYDGTPNRGVKRKRTLFEQTDIVFSKKSTSKGDIEISDVCTDGSFVKLYNKGSKEAALGSWQVVRKVGDSTVTFKLHHTVKLEAGGIITIYSSESEEPHDPPHSLVMKNQKWIIGDVMETLLLNNKGEEMATLTVKKEKHYTSSNRGRQYLVSRDGSLYQTEGTGEKCCIM